MRTPLRLQSRQFLRFAFRLTCLFVAVAFADSAFAQQMVGQSLLTFAGNYIIAPLGIFAMVMALAGAFFRPDLAKAGVYAAFLCAILYFLIRSAPQLSAAMKN